MDQSDNSADKNGKDDPTDKPTDKGGDDESTDKEGTDENDNFAEGAIPDDAGSIKFLTIKF